jgi:hypothetical protein
MPRKSWAQRNPKRHKEIKRNSDLKAKYGISLATYNQMLRDQGHQCMLCEEKHGKTSWTTLVVDHNHQTGQVRGLLCRRCNSAIGFVDERVDVLARMIAYVS